MIANSHKKGYEGGIVAKDWYKYSGDDSTGT